MFVRLTSLLLILFIEQGDFSRTASVVLYRNGTNITLGILNMSQSDSTSSVVITGSIQQLHNNSQHGFHVHASLVSDYIPNCLAAGEHFNPYNVHHGPQTGNLTTRHVGDLGNITTNINGTAIVAITDSIIDLYNTTRSIVNRTLVVHTKFDNINSNSSTGNAGDPLACGVIKLILHSNSAQQLSTINIRFILSSIFFFIFFF